MLSSRLEDKVKEQELKKTGINTDSIRHDNKQRVKELYHKLNIFKKSPDFDQFYLYKAMNISGIGLKQNDFAQIREGKYIQIIASTYVPYKDGKKRVKHTSIGYFGKAKTLDRKLINEIVEFVLRWRYEKAFQNVEHYKNLIARI